MFFFYLLRCRLHFSFNCTLYTRVIWKFARSVKFTEKERSEHFISISIPATMSISCREMNWRKWKFFSQRRTIRSFLFLTVNRRTKHPRVFRGPSQLSRNTQEWNQTDRRIFFSLPDTRGISALPLMCKYILVSTKKITRYINYTLYNFKYILYYSLSSSR